MKEIASVVIRVYPSTRRRLKIGAAKKGQTLAAHVDEISGRPVWVAPKNR